MLDNHLDQVNDIVISRSQLAHLHQFPQRRETVPQEYLQKFARSREDSGNVKDSLEFANYRSRHLMQRPNQMRSIFRRTKISLVDAFRNAPDVGDDPMERLRRIILLREL